MFVLETTIEVETLAQVAFNKEQFNVLSWYHTDESNQEASSENPRLQGRRVEQHQVGSCALSSDTSDQKPPSHLALQKDSLRIIMSK